MAKILASRYWVLCGVILLPHLGCGGDADSSDGGGASIPRDEPGQRRTPDAPVMSAAPLAPAESDPAAPDEPAAPSETALPGEPPPFSRETCSIFPQFRADTPLDDTRGTGFSALDMLTVFNEQEPGTLTWFDGTTTALRISVRPAGNISDVDDSPRGEGFCVPFRGVPVQLRIESADGRLAEDFASELVANGYDGNIESVWLSDARLPLDALQGNLEVPSDWLIAGHTERRLDFETAWAPRDSLGPFCTASDVPSTDASDGCNVYGGVVRFYSSTPVPDDPAAGSPAFDRFREVAGSWARAL